MGLVLGVMAAVAAGASFAMAGVLQQRAAGRTSGQQDLSVGLLASLVRQRLWLVGIGLAVLSYGFQALALAAAPLVLVQPLMVCELIFAIPVSARLYGRPLGVREWAGLLAIAVGIAATVWGAAPHGGGSTGAPLRWATVGGGLAAGAGLVALVARRRSVLLRAALYAVAAALLFGLSSALLAAMVHGFQTDGIGGLGRPWPYGMAAAELSGFLLIQSAFKDGPLAVSMPMVDFVEPLVAVLLGVSVLGEAISTDSVHLGALGVGALAALSGILTLDSSPAIRNRPQPAVADTTSLACACRATRRSYGAGTQQVTAGAR